MSKKAVILLSGGLDSSSVLAYAVSQGYECYALSFAYGQRHEAELAAAQRVAQHFAVKQHKIFNLDIGQFGGSALTNTDWAVPAYSASDQIPITYVPARNTVFLSIALGWAEILGAYELFIGVSSVDYSGYPDCRPEFIESFQQLANVATKAGVEGQTFTLHTPLLYLDKAATIQLGLTHGVDFSQTVSCYQADAFGLACGQCDSCVLRQQGFAAAGVPDPTRYQQPFPA